MFTNPVVPYNLVDAVECLSGEFDFRISADDVKSCPDDDVDAIIESGAAVDDDEVDVSADDDKVEATTDDDDDDSDGSDWMVETDDNGLSDDDSRADTFNAADTTANIDTTADN